MLLWVLSTNWIKRWFLTTKRARSCKNYFCCTIYFLKGSFAPKNFNISKLESIYKYNMIYIYMFFQSCYAIFLKLCCNSSPFFCSWIIKDKFTRQIIHTPHDLRFASINNVIIIYNEKWPTKCIPIMPFPFFSFQMQFL